MNEAAEAFRFQSGFQASQESATNDYALGEIRAANETLLQRTGLQLELPISVLVEQRDNALRWYVYERTKGELLQAEHQRELDTIRQAARSDLEAALQQHRAQLDALRAEQGTSASSRAVSAGPSAAAAPLGPSTTLTAAGTDSRVKTAVSALSNAETPVSRATVVVRSGEPNLLGEVVVEDLRNRLSELEQHNHQLEQRNTELDILLKEAIAVVEETRKEAHRAQGERDEALARADDTRIRMQTELDGTRDELSALQALLDETRRDADSARDQAQLEMMRLNEELTELRESLVSTS